MTIYIIKVVVDGMFAAETVSVSYDHMEFCYNDIELIEKGSPPFHALMNIRRKLEKQNILLAINACLKEVYPSGMQVSCGVTTAYICIIGEFSKPFKMIDIFGEISDTSLISTVEEQEQYHKECVKSFKQKNRSERR